MTIESQFHISVCKTTDGEYVAMLGIELVPGREMKVLLTPAQAEIAAHVLLNEGTIEVHILDHGDEKLMLPEEDARVIAQGLRDAAAILRSPTGLRMCLDQVVGVM